MSDKDVQSFIITIPFRRTIRKSFAIQKPLRPRNTNKDKMLRSKPSDTTLKKYKLPGNSPVRVEKLKQAVMFLPIRRFIKYEEHLKHKRLLNTNFAERYKIGAIDFNNRLYDEIPEEDVRAITDVDPKFYKIVNGRVLKHQIPMFKTLQSLFNEQLRIRQDIGFRNECILNMVTNSRHELKTYEIALKRCIQQVKQYDKFISTDYKRSMAMLEKSEEVKLKLDFKQNELNNLALEKFNIVSRLVGLDHQFRVQQMYGRFLYYLSPPSWRSRNREFAHSVEIERKGFDLGASEEDDTFSVIFEKLVKECFTEPIHPCLYFTKPEDLMVAFESVEKQQLNHFIHVTHFTPHARKLKDGIRKLKAQMDWDSAVVAGTIEKFQILIESAEEQSDALKAQFFKILNGQFYESVASPEVLKLFVHLEFCCHKVFGTEPSSFNNLVPLAKVLEDFYLSYSMRLDEIHSDVVKKAMARCIEADKSRLQRAELAARELRLFNRLERELHRAFAPVAADREAAKLMQEAAALSRKESQKNSRVSRQKSKCHRAVPPQRVLTEAEQEYLKFFTDWNENEDPAKYLLSLSYEDHK